MSSAHLPPHHEGPSTHPGTPNAAAGWLSRLDLAPFRPRLIDSIKDYNRGRFFVDLGAGLTVGIVALPLAMAFAIASGVKPEAGLFTAIIAGFLISALGGSNGFISRGAPRGAAPPPFVPPQQQPRESTLCPRPCPGLPRRPS